MFLPSGCTNRRSAEGTTFGDSRPLQVKGDKSGVEMGNVKMSMNPFCEIAVEQDSLRTLVCCILSSHS